MVGVLGQHRSQLPTAEDEHPVQHLTPNGADPPLRVGVRPRCRTGVCSIWIPSAAKTASKAAVNLVSRSRSTNRTDRYPPQVHHQVSGLLCYPLPHRWLPNSAPAVQATGAHGRTADTAVVGSCADHRGLMVLRRTRSSAPTTDFLAPTSADACGRSSGPRRCGARAAPAGHQRHGRCAGRRSASPWCS